ncbi:MAG TPA: DUF2252 family protein [Vicinamibacterales bacterium]|nr:DUF2252 family protein [Vicinamibacterales bacterium]
MAALTAADRIRAFNRGRDPERLAMKLRAIRADPFKFLRGTCHLFYEHLPRDPLVRRAPDAWLCGDLHLQNMGSYKGDNRLVYYDINDFDEAALGPCTIDLLRFATSILVGADGLSIRRGDALAICGGAIDAYAAALRSGQARWVEAETAEGVIAELLHRLARPGRRRMLNARTIQTGGGRRLRTDGRKALPASAADRARVTLFMKEFAARQDNPRFFRMIDVARRIAGTGSLGVNRFVILVEGRGSPDGNFLLDLKHARPSCLTPHLATRQPRWSNEAERVTSIQVRMQAVSQAFLHAERMDGQWYVLRDLQPSEDRVDLALLRRDPSGLRTAVEGMARLLAWDQLRSTGRQRSAIADELIEFGAKRDLRKGMVDLAVQCSGRVVADWKDYCESDMGIG